MGKFSRELKRNNSKLLFITWNYICRHKPYWDRSTTNTVLEAVYCIITTFTTKDVHDLAMHLQKIWLVPFLFQRVCIISALKLLTQSEYCKLQVLHVLLNFYQDSLSKCDCHVFHALLYFFDFENMFRLYLHIS